MMKYILFSMLTLWSFSCEKINKEPPSPIKIILDTDIGSDCDDVGALALLNEYSNQGKAEILGVIYSSGVVPYGVGIIDAINRYYGNDHIPIGATHEQSIGDPIDKMQAKKLAEDTAAFKNRVIQNSDVSEQTQLTRSLLAKEDDDVVVYITIGHTKGLYDLLTSKPDSISLLSGYELTKRKIKGWVALGALKANNQEDRYVKDWSFI